MQERIKRLVEERARTWEQAKALLDTAETESRDLSGEEEGQWTALNETMTQLDERITELEELRARNEQADEVRQRYERAEPASDGKLSEDEQWRQFLSSPIDPKTGQRRSMEISLSQLKVEVRGTGVWEVRDLSKLTAAAGGDLVPTGFRRQLYQHLIENSAIRQTNVTVLTTNSGEAIQVPKTTAHYTAALVAEADPLVESDPTFGQVTLDAFKYGRLIQVSSELIADNAVDLVGYLAANAGAALGNASGAHFVTGTGTGQPNGVVDASTLGVTGGAGVAGAFTADNLIDLWVSVIEPYASRGWWLFRRATLGNIRKLKDQQDQYLWQPGLAGDTQSTILGRPYVTDPNVPAVALSAKSVLFGDFSAYYIRDVAGVRFERSDDFAFGNDLVSFRAILRTDGDLVDTTGAIKHFIGNAA